MNKKRIEKQLRGWFGIMTGKYCWLRIKFEFNEQRGVFMVSFAPAHRIDRSDGFNRDAMEFADKLNDEYGNEAPLFTDEEELFSLSANAELVNGNSFVSAGNPSPTNTDVRMPIPNPNSLWSSDTAVSVSSATKNFRQTVPESSFAFAS